MNSIRSANDAKGAKGSSGLQWHFFTWKSAESADTLNAGRLKRSE
jgi:hypothetical protein